MGVLTCAIFAIIFATVTFLVLQFCDAVHEFIERHKFSRASREREDHFCEWLGLDPSTKEKKK